MAWWDDVLGLLKDEWKVLGGESAASDEPPSIKQAQTLLKRTSKELSEAQARAEASRRRMLRAQADLEALTQDPAQHPRYRDRLTELAHAISHESAMVDSFDSHIQQLGLMHDRVERQLRKLEADLNMARSARAAAQTTHAVDPKPRTKPNPETTSGFKRARPDAVMESLREVGRKTGLGARDAEEPGLGARGSGLGKSRAKERGPSTGKSGDAKE